MSKHAPFPTSPIPRHQARATGGHRELQDLKRFVELGKLSAGLLHDISSPLAAALLHLEQENAADNSNIRQARQNIRTLERYVSSARHRLTQRGHARMFSVRTEWQEARLVLLPLARRSRVILRHRVKDDYQLHGDPVLFQRILVNVVTNAIEAALASSNIQGRVDVTIAAVAGRLIVRVRDNGSGIPADRLPHIFESFYTTKNRSQYSGLGMGLAVVKQYMQEDFHGKITVSSKAGRGTCFNLSFPLTTSLSQPERTPT